ncbi:MAG: TRAP transporter large permease [Caldimonas sp.]
MDALTIGYVCVGLMIVSLFLGIPVAAAMGVLGMAGMALAVGSAFAIGQLRTLPYAVVSNYDYAVLPMFVLMGTIISNSGMTERLFYAAEVWLQRLRGGLYMAVIAGSAVFAAVNGSTVVSSVVFTRIAYPEMLRYNYPRSLSIGSICATGSFAAMIPPSITMVLYAIICEQSVGQLLIAGIIPGILTALVYAGGVACMVRIWPKLAPPVREAVPLATRLRALRSTWPVLVLIVLMMGGIYGGFFTPTLGGSVGAVGALLIALGRARGRFKEWLPKSLTEAASISCLIFTILIGGLLFSRLVVVTGVVDSFVGVITNVSSSPLSFMIVVSIFYLILGCFIDTTSMMIVTLPFIFPAVLHYQIDPIWFGIVLVKLIEIAVITPPVGLNLFAVMSVVDKETSWRDLVMGVMPFIALEVVVLGLLVAFPGLVTWLPGQMIR